ncbi:hypothetical protein ACN27J_21175 [Solwaraspora sp. WMMB762]|uniref:hypothetical protein n=1 Tax=Solwaraspora sp. WMMB762 TaxID=3404120 RepID=UPI003B9427BF
MVEDGRVLHPEPWLTIKKNRVCQSPVVWREAKDREIKSGSGKAISRDSYQWERQLAQPRVQERAHVEVAVVGCYARHEERAQHPRGWGYLASDGHFGFGATTTFRKYDGDGELAAECRALFWAIKKLVPYRRIEILTDYPEIVHMVDAWRQGDITAAPPGYNHDRRPSGREPKLHIAGRIVGNHADAVTTKLLSDYSESGLGLGADKLSVLGWRWCAGDLDKESATAMALAAAADSLGVSPDLVQTPSAGDRQEADQTVV